MAKYFNRTGRNKNKTVARPKDDSLSAISNVIANVITFARSRAFFFERNRMFYAFSLSPFFPVDHFYHHIYLICGKDRSDSFGPNDVFHRASDDAPLHF